MRAVPGRSLALLAAGLLLAAVAATHAQGDGQFCLRSFEDRNGNGVLDPGEPLLTAGVSAELHDAEGLVLASGLLDESPTAAQGMVCFQFLQSGEYTLLASSAMSTATGPVRFTQRVEAGGAPVLVDFGARFMPAPTAVAPSRPARDLTQLLPRLAVSLLGALLVSGVMLVLGALIWFLALRRPAPENPRRP